MNRIVLRYKEKDNNNLSSLNIYNDIKGLSCEKICETLYDESADIMFKLLKNVDYSKINNCILYECTILKNGDK